MKISKAVVEEITGDSITLLAGEEEREIIVSKDDIDHPEVLKTGDWLDIEITGDKVKIIRVNEEKTGRVKKRIQEKMNLLRKRSAGNRNDDKK